MITFAEIQELKDSGLFAYLPESIQSDIRDRIKWGREDTPYRDAYSRDEQRVRNDLMRILRMPVDDFLASPEDRQLLHELLEEIPSFIRDATYSAVLPMVVRDSVDAMAKDSQVMRFYWRGYEHESQARTYLVRTPEDLSVAYWNSIRVWYAAHGRWLPDKFSPKAFLSDEVKALKTIMDNDPELFSSFPAGMQYIVRSRVERWEFDVQEEKKTHEAFLECKSLIEKFLLGDVDESIRHMHEDGGETIPLVNYVFKVLHANEGVTPIHTEHDMLPAITPRQFLETSPPWGG